MTEEDVGWRAFFWWVSCLNPTYDFKEASFHLRFIQGMRSGFMVMV
ncbi:hypothetical protein [Cyanobacterium aponinum]|nr:hypothetical protein [Cyanobacterium aponinum]